jgi:hypothetical protein
MFTAFGVTIVLYFIKILSGSRTFYLSSAISHPRFIFHPPFLIRHPYPPSLSAILISHPYPRFIPTRLPIDSIDYEQTYFSIKIDTPLAAAFYVSVLNSAYLITLIINMKRHSKLLRH